MAGIIINSKKQETENTYSDDEHRTEFIYEYVSESECVRRKKQLFEGTDGDNNNNNRDDIHNTNYEPTVPTNQNEQSDHLVWPPVQFFPYPN